MLTFKSNTTDRTEEIGKMIGELLVPKDVVCLTGDLGVGKTTFVKGLAKGMGIDEHLTSPTFTIVNEYYGSQKLYHFDVYRVNDPDELFEIGFDEYIHDDAVSVIEWAELINSILPKEKLWIEIKKDIEKDESYREIILKPYGEKFIRLTQNLTVNRSEDE